MATVRLMNPHGQWYDQAQQELVRASEDLEVLRMLDLGVGTGETSRRCLEAHPAARAVCLDESEEQRARLWTPRVWPGALLVEGEIRGTWRRAQHTVRIEAWTRISRSARSAVEAEAIALPLPGLTRPVEVVWDT